MPAPPMPPVRLKNGNFANYAAALWEYLTTFATGIARHVPPPCRAVATSLLPYGNQAPGILTGVGPLGLQDDVTLSPGDRLFIPLTAALEAGGRPEDQGPYIVGEAAGNYMLTRAPEWAHGTPLLASATIPIAEGKRWAGNQWRAFPTRADTTIGAGDPHFWPRSFAAELAPGVVDARFWLRDPNRVTLTDLGDGSTGGTASAAPTASACFAVLVAGAGDGRVAVRGPARHRFGVMAVNF